MDLSSIRHLAVAGVCAFGLVSAAAAAGANSYVVTNLVSDGTLPAAQTDVHLKNAWGVAFNPFGLVWVNNNRDGTSTLYDGNGVPQSLVVAVPAADGVSKGSPTGIIFNGSVDFVVSNGTVSGASRFIFASEDGVISGWAPTVDGTHALRAVVTPGANYKGIAAAANGTANLLYATDFRNGRINVFDRSFAPVSVAGGFVDPNVPARFAPFGIQNVNGNLYVTYAKRDAGGDEDVTGRGLGFVNVFDTEGRLLRRVASVQGMNAPWGIAMAPANFGQFSNRLLIGNLGDGTISAYDAQNGDFVGRLRNADGKVVKIPGLWGMQFGNGLFNQPTNTLFFAAGPNGENGGVYGSVKLGE